MFRHLPPGSSRASCPSSVDTRTVSRGPARRRRHGSPVTACLECPTPMDVSHPGPAPATTQPSLPHQARRARRSPARCRRGRVPGSPRRGGGAASGGWPPRLHCRPVRGARRGRAADGATTQGWPSRGRGGGGPGRGPHRLAGGTERSEGAPPAARAVRERARGVPLRRTHPPVHPPRRRRSGPRSWPSGATAGWRSGAPATPRSAPWCSPATTSPRASGRRWVTRVRRASSRMRRRCPSGGEARSPGPTGTGCGTTESLQ